jgi:hypothetical protein
MVHDLSSLTARGTKSQTIYNIVDTTLEEHEKLSSGDTLRSSGAIKRVTELSFEETV